MSAPFVACENLDYEIHLFKQGRELKRGQQTRLRGLSYGRKLNDISTAEVEVFVPGKDCAGQLAAADHWNTTLVVTNKGEEVWNGPCKKIRYRRDSVIIEASDNLVWANKRFLHKDLSYVATAIEDIALAIFNNSVMDIDPRDVILRVYESGFKESRDMQASQNRLAWSILSEMLGNGLDVTTFGRQLLFGLPKFGLMELTDRDIVGDVEVVKDGDDMVNFVITDAQNSTMATFPVAREGSNGYPLLEGIINDGQITDQQSALNAAEARYNWSKNGVRRVVAAGGLELAASTKIDPKTLICGQLINFTANECCYSATETMRLGSIDVTVAAGIEKAAIGLQPIGTYGETL